MGQQASVVLMVHVYTSHGSVTKIWTALMVAMKQTVVIIYQAFNYVFCFANKFNFPVHLFVQL